MIYYINYVNYVRYTISYNLLPDLEWQLSDLVIHNHMIQLIMPENVYANISLTVVCRVSTILFSYGTIISDKETPELETGTWEKTKVVRVINVFHVMLF